MAITFVINCLNILILVCLYHSLCVYGTAETLDGVAELPDTQTAQQTDVKETYCSVAAMVVCFGLLGWI